MSNTVQDEKQAMDEKRAREVLGRAIQGDDIDLLGNSLYSESCFAQWHVGDERANLDGKFTLEQLEAIAWWMRNKGQQ